MYIPNDDTQNYPSIAYDWWFKRFDTKRNEPTNQRVPKVVKTTNKKSLSYYFGD